MKKVRQVKEWRIVNWDFQHQHHEMIMQVILWGDLSAHVERFEKISNVLFSDQICFSSSTIESLQKHLCGVEKTFDRNRENLPKNDSSQSYAKTTYTWIQNIANSALENDNIAERLITSFMHRCYLNVKSSTNSKVN